MNLAENEAGQVTRLVTQGTEGSLVRVGGPLTTGTDSEVNRDEGKS